MDILDLTDPESEDSEADLRLQDTCIPPEQRLSTQERLRLAKRRRAEQLRKWAQREREWKMTSATSNFKGQVTSKGITFVPSVMLLEAAARNDLGEVRRLLEVGVSPDSTNEDGLTALHQCCIDDSEEMMKLLIQFGGNPNATDTEKWTPLHAAATCGHLHLVKFLIDAGAELLSVNADGNMPYDLCEDDTTLSYIENEMARRGVTQELIDDTRSATERRMLGDLASHHSQGCDLEIKDMTGATPLHVASANGYLSVVEFLLDHHVSTEAVDLDLWQPIHAAACWGHLEVVEMLAQNGANVNARTRNGETPFDICEDPDIKERLLQLKEQRLQLQQPRVRRTRSASTRTQSIRRTSLREKMNTTKRDVQDEKMYFMHAVDGQKDNVQADNGAGDLNISHNGSNDIVDIKDVELTLLPSYLDGDPAGGMAEVIHHKDTPPKRPPRTNPPPQEGVSPAIPDKINVHVTVNSPDALSSNSQVTAAAAASGSSPAGGPQTLSDLKKQRSLSRQTNQGSPSPSKQSSSSSRHSSNSSLSQNHVSSSGVSSRPMPQQPPEGAKSKKHHRSSKNGRSQPASSAEVKKFAADEIVGPPSKKTGCCRIM